MTDPTETASRARLFLDAGVIIEGCFAAWGAAKAVLILATLRQRFTVVLAEAIEREVRRAIATRTAGMDAEHAAAVARGVAGWLDRVRLERVPLPSPDDVRALAPVLLPALRHVNDLPAAVSAVQARPDWVISSNQEHWTPQLAARTGLRIVTPRGFRDHLAVPARPASSPPADG
ncbi:MAG TPA: hypothetical protein VG370_00890 [Chloroflexota bacterium]|nr:hypothetical protein [Chloroflexota bacterium]